MYTPTICKLSFGFVFYNDLSSHGYYSLMATYHTIIAAKKEYFFLMTTKQYIMWPAVFVIHIFGLR